MGSGNLLTGVFRAGLCALCVAFIAGCGGAREGQENALPPNGGGGGSSVTQPTVSFAVTTASVSEGGAVNIEVSLSATSSTAVSVPFSLSGTATASFVDYVASASPITIDAGARTASITVTAVDDSEDEPDETVILTMGTPVNANAGTATTTVTVTDNDEPPPPGASGRITHAATGDSVAGITVSSGSANATSVANGTYLLTNVTNAASVVINFDGDGYVPQSRTTEGLATTGAHVVVNVPMVPVELTQSFDPAAGWTGTISGSAAQAIVAADSLRTTAGATPSGSVTAQLTPVMAAVNVGLTPGNYRAIASGGAAGPIETFGALDLSITDASGSALVLAAGTTVSIRIPVSSRDTSTPTTVSLFYFDSVTGMWHEEGTATLAGTDPNQYYEGTVSRLAIWAAGSLYPPINVTGCVEDAVGARIVGAAVIAEGRDYVGSAQTLTDASGNFTVPVKADSLAFVQASRGSAVSNSPQVTAQTASITLSPCLVLTGGTLSVKLTWGDAPADLDSHTLGANADDHVYYAGRGSLTAQPYIALDVDDVTGFGPEVTTFSGIARNRRYSFYVHNFSGTFTPGQTQSPARVELTAGGTQTVFAPPAGETTQTEYWHVFDLTTDDNCVVTVVPVQQFKQVEPLNLNVGNDAAFCR
ncbi:MAG TPA: Calx-beta domain-containing protein [Povalibacter sp.]